MTRKDKAFIGIIISVKLLVIAIILTAAFLLTSQKHALTSHQQDMSAHVPPPGTLIISRYAPVKGDHIQVYQDKSTVYIDVYSENRNVPPFSDSFQCSQQLTAENVRIGWQAYPVGMVDRYSSDIDSAGITIKDGIGLQDKNLYNVYVSFTDSDKTRRLP